MRNKRGWGLLASLVMLGACAMPDGGEVLDRLELTQSQRMVADALVEGMAKDAAFGILRKREYLLAGCYATKVSIPPAHERAHLAYLANFQEADDDYYGFFARYGLDQQEAFSMFERYDIAMTACGNG